METDSSCGDNQPQLVFGRMTSSGITGNKQISKWLSPSRFQEPPGVWGLWGLVVASSNMRINVTIIFREIYAPTADVVNKKPLWQNWEKKKLPEDKNICCWLGEDPAWRDTLWGVNGFFSRCWQVWPLFFWSARATSCCASTQRAEMIKTQNWNFITSPLRSNHRTCMPVLIRFLCRFQRRYKCTEASLHWILL